MAVPNDLLRFAPMPDQQNAPPVNGLLDTSLADAWSQNAAAIRNYVAQQRAASQAVVTQYPNMPGAPPAPPNILGPEYDNLPPQYASGPFYPLRDRYKGGYTPWDAQQRAIDNAAEEYMAQRKTAASRREQ